MALLPNNITVPHEELGGSPVESIDENGDFTGVRTLICDWDQRQQLAGELLGHVGSGDGVFVLANAFPPHVDGGIGNPARAVAIDEIKPFFEHDLCPSPGEGAPSTSAQAAYSKAQIRVRYRRTVNEEDNGGGGSDEILIEERLDGEHELITLPHRNLAWKTAIGTTSATKACFPVDEMEVPARVIGACVWVVTFHRVRPPLNENFINLLGLISNSTIRSKRYGINFPANTLLYLDFGSTASYNYSDGSTLLSIEARFAFRRNQRVKDGAILGWNGYWRAAASDFDNLVEYEQGTSPGDPGPQCQNDVRYPEGDLSLLGLATI